MSEFGTSSLSPSALSEPSPSTRTVTDGDVHTKRLEVEKMHLLNTRAAPATYIPVLTAATLLVCFLWPVVEHDYLVCWFITMSMTVGSTWSILHFYQQDEKPRAEHLGQWYKLACVNAAFSGFGWGMAGFFLLPLTSGHYQLVLLLVLCGVSIIAVAYLAVIRRVFFLFFAMLVFPTLLRLLLDNADGSFMIAILLVSFTLFLIPITNYMHTSVVESLRLRFHN